MTKAEEWSGELGVFILIILFIAFFTLTGLLYHGKIGTDIFSLFVGLILGYLLSFLERFFRI